MATYQRVVTETSDGVISQDTTGNAATATTASAAPYSGLTGTVPTWNQSTTGNAATATNVAYTGLTGSVPTWNQNTTGTAAKADELSKAVTIGGVSFSGKGDIDLPGVNTAGNQNTSGTAASATALATAGGLSLSGAVTATKTTYTSGGDVALSTSMADNVVSAGKLTGKGAKLGNGTTGQFLTSGGDGTFAWANQTSANNGTMTISAGEGLATGGSFTANQSNNTTVTLDLDSSVAGTGLSYSSGVLSVDASQAITGVTGNFSIAGDLTVSGSTITTTTETLEINDNVMVLNADAKSDIDSGMVVKCDGGNNGVLYFDASEDAWYAGIGTGTDLTTGVKARRLAVQNVQSSLDTNDTATPVGGMQVANGVLYIRTA